MKADAYEISKVFGFERQLFAPLFQRPYVWKKKEQWVPLWEDIKRLGENLLACDDERATEEVRPHFLGAIVLDQYRVPIGKPDARSIIDGQQRLTSLQLFIAAFRDAVVGYGTYDKQVRRLNRLIYNDDVEDEMDRFKVWPTNIDRGAYRAVMMTDDPDELNKRLREQGLNRKARLVRAYKYFHKAVQEWLDSTDSDETRERRIDCLTNAIREKIRLVVIDMDHQDDAQSIFETLNARGTPLLPSDLVKNYLFRRALQEKANMDDLHTQYWVEFERDDEFWRGMFGVGHAKRPRMDLFFQHYLTLQTSKEIPVAAIFDEFRGFAEQNSDSVAWHLQNLRDYSRHFKKFMEAEANSREGIFLRRLSTMQFTTVYPFLMGLYQATHDDDSARVERDKILIDIESFLVRRMICRLSTRGYNQLFLELLKELRERDEFSRERVRSFLLDQTAEAGRWPDDKEFLDSWLSVEIYEAITRPRLRMVLRALDEQLHTSRTEPYVLDRGLTVEHLLPQHWESHWPLEPLDGESAQDYIARKDRRNSLLHTFGNLTILTSSLNPDVSNGPFDKKRKKILEHTVLNLSRFLHKQDTWDEDCVVERGRKLFEAATKIWPYPGK